MDKSLLKKLIDQAGFSTTYERERLERLVESTIKECVRQLEDLHLSQTTNNQNHPSEWHDGVDSCINFIKEYFEV
jgi:hypothetical protein